MLIDFSLKNFRSFNDKQTLTLVKDAGREMEETNTSKSPSPASVSLVRSAAIYGANSAGKSNLIDAIRVFQQIVRESSRKTSINDELRLEPFLLSTKTENQPTEFEINFIVKGVRYQFGFVANQERILEEWLLAYPNRRPQLWYERTCTNKTTHWEFGTKLTGSKQTWANVTRDNALFLSTAVQLNSRQLTPVYDWLVGSLEISSKKGWNGDVTTELCQHQGRKNQVLEFLAKADLDIVDIKTKKKDIAPDSMFAELEKTHRDGVFVRFSESSLNYFDIKTARVNNQGEQVFLDFRTESLGTQKLYDLAGPWITALDNGHTLFVDEMNNHFHPKLIEYLVSLFHNSETNKHNAQLVFTTHETSILNQDIFRRDQIWFVERDPVKGSTVFPLTDFSPRKTISNLESAYLSGRYGGIPYINREPLRVAEESPHRTYHSKKT